jgi:hypothetical protein
MMTLDQYRARRVVKEFLDNSYINIVKDDVDGVNWENLQKYADEAKDFEKAPPEERD